MDYAKKKIYIYIPSLSSWCFQIKESKSINISILAFQNRLMEIVFIYSVTGSSDPEQAELSEELISVKTKPEKNHRTHKDNMSFQGDSPAIC